MNNQVKVCSVEGCTKDGRLKRGMCENHYARSRRTPKPKVTRCEVEGCERTDKLTRGLCGMHYQRWARENLPGFREKLNEHSRKSYQANKEKYLESGKAYRLRKAENAKALKDAGLEPNNPKPGRKKKPVPTQDHNYYAQALINGDIHITISLKLLASNAGLQQHTILPMLDKLQENELIKSYTSSVETGLITLVVERGMDLTLFGDLNQQPDEIDGEY